MTTWVLVMSIAYAAGVNLGGGVALNGEKVEFFSEKECFEARAQRRSDLKADGFTRFSLSCLKRSGPFLEPEGRK